MSEEDQMEISPKEDDTEIDELKTLYETAERENNFALFNAILDNPRSDDVAIKVKEQSIYKVAKFYADSKDFELIMNLLKQNADFFSVIPKAKTAKIVRNLLNIVSSTPDSLVAQVNLYTEVVEWCKVEKRTFLRQRIEGKLATLLLQQKQPTKALSIIDDLLKELKKLDDKQMLTETHLTEARIYHSLQNIPKSKASLTASRTAANSIYVVPLLQAEIDEMSGILHCEESDYTTAFSYFLEAFDAYDQSQQSSSAVTCLQYMMLCKILNESPNEVAPLLSSKIGLKHAGKNLDAMAAIAKAAKSHSLEDFQKAVGEFEQYLRTDYLISHHLDLLYDKMLESNLLKIIHPYNVVEIHHIAKLINLAEDLVVQKLSQMILDHKFFGILDQGKGHLIIYETSKEDFNFAKGTEIINNLGQVVDALFGRTKTFGKAKN